MPDTEKRQDPAIDVLLSSPCSRGLEFLLTRANLHSESIKHFQSVCPNYAEVSLSHLLLCESPRTILNLDVLV